MSTPRYPEHEGSPMRGGTPAGAAVDRPSWLVEARDMTIAYPAHRPAFWLPKPAPVLAVSNVSFGVAPGETLGIVGESGSGKSTIGRAVLGRVPLRGGQVLFRGQRLAGLSNEALRRLRAQMQPVLQDPYASLNPRMRVGDIVAEPMVVHGTARGQALRERVAELLGLVGLSPDDAARLPGSFSGGQRQRIGIARALAVRPSFIVADEPVSALDVSVRAQIVNLFAEIQRGLGVSFLFISHDLAVVRHLSHQVAIVHAGRIVESGRRDEIYRDARHPYTRALLAAVPVPDPGAPRLPIARGEPEAAAHPGCRYAARCPEARQRCREEAPVWVGVSATHQVACWEQS